MCLVHSTIHEVYNHNHYNILLCNGLCLLDVFFAILKEKVFLFLFVLCFQSYIIMCYIIILCAVKGHSYGGRLEGELLKIVPVLVGYSG